MELNGYDLSRKWFDFCFENPDKISPGHTALYFFAIEHCNRLGWKQKFGFPTTMAMEAIGIKSYNTYIKIFNDLIEFGFIKLIQKSTNQYSSNIIALSNFNKALDKALDKALIKHDVKRHESNDSINKQLTNKPINNKQITDPIAFYENEIKENLNGKEIFGYKSIYKIIIGENEFSEKLNNVLSIPEQITYKQYVSLYDKSVKKGKQISNILLTMDNKKQYCKGKTSLSRTIHTWLNNDFK